MYKVSRKRSRATLALVALIAVAGCSSLPTGPRPEVESQPAAAGGTAAVGTVGAKLSPISTQLATSSKSIYGALGGQVTAGNFTVVIPPSAISGTATVRVTQPDASKPYVSLEISPGSANKFRVPVILIANATPMTGEKLAEAYIAWFNPSTRKWEPMVSSEANLTNRTVICPLSHFSTYSVQSGGKAGW